MIAALYVAADGPYQALGCDCYDVTRDARTYTGAGPVVAHPPCGPWGRYAHRCHQDPSTAWHALDVVRRNGGVLEHPTSSRLWREASIPVGDWHDPCREVDDHGGYTLRIMQRDLGHRAAKSTVLYIVDHSQEYRLPVALACRVEEHEAVPVERMGHRERCLTPGALAHVLVQLAQACGRPPGPAQTELFG